MNYKKQYDKLQEAYRRLEKELESYRSGSHGKSDIDREMIFNVFHSASHLMAISNLNNGKYIDVNNTFLSLLGYSKNEVVGSTAEDIRLFVDLEESNKYLKLTAKLGKIKEYPIYIRTKSGEEKQYLLSAEIIRLVNENYLLTIFSEINYSEDRKIIESQGKMVDEIFETISSYLALYSIGNDNKIYIIDLNRKVEEVEFIRKEDVVGRCIDDTALSRRLKLTELLHHIRITGDSHKLAASMNGDDSEGFYMGFRLSSGNIVITWEPGYKQKNLDDLYRQGEFFEKFAEMLPQIIFEIDLEGNVVYGNKQGLDFFGYTREDLKAGMNVAEIFPDNYEQMYENINQLKSPGQITNREYTVKRKDGSLVPILTHTFGIFLGNKKIGYRGVVTDMTKYKEYENQIKKEKVFLEHLYDSAPVAIAITNESGIISMVNMEFTNLFGFTSEEAVKRKINDLVVPDDLIEEAERVDNLASLNLREVRKTVRKDKYGNKIHVDLVATSIVINNENVARLGIYRDITSEIKNQLLQEILYNISSAALKQNEIKEIYPAIVTELSKIWDTNNFFIGLYDKASDTVSLPVFTDEKDSFQEFPVKKTITGWVIKNNKSVLLKEGDLKVLEEEGNIDLIGTPCKVWMGVPLNVEEKTIGVMCLQDYNDENKFSADDLNILEFIANQIAIAIQRRMMLDDLIFARQKAEEAAQAKQLFMSTMSHEIRTPLNEVIGITNLLLQGNPREDQMDYINTLKFSGNHLLTLVNDVLDYNKMESGKIVFEKVQFNLGSFLDEILRSYSFRSKAKNLEFDIVKGSGLPEDVIGDPIRLNQILSNLLSNALKFTNQGSINVYVKELRRTNMESQIEFNVTDTGIGIPKDRHSSIFDSFTQAAADTTRRFGGSGLGLAICKKLIELQGGSITVKSEPGVGSSFSFAILLEIPVGNRQKGESEKIEEYTGLEGKKILVAEDNKINFFVANKFLTGWGVRVTQAENGQLALEMLENQEFDLILMDLHMPVMDGIEATRIIRNSKDPKLKNIPIVALTAAIMSESHDKIEDLNINDYVLKPFKPHDLFERIRKHIR